MVRTRTRPYSPKADDIEKLDREMLAKLRRERLIPNNAMFIAVGDVKAEEVVQQLTDHFGDCSKEVCLDLEFETPPKRTSRSMTIVDRPGSPNQTSS
jgi:predicted Zn-dependent peptidase